MRRIVPLLLAALVALAPAAPLRAGEGRAAEIEAVIGRQIAAFLAEDVETAFGFASPAIRALFGTPERFGRMVREGYPMVWRPAQVRFLDLREEAGRLRQRVMITDAEGRLHLLDYEMIELDGGWRINGVRILRAAGAGA